MATARDDGHLEASANRRLDACDLVLCKGVKSTTSSLLTLSYRFLGDCPRLGLVCQKAVKLDHLKDRLIHADMKGDAFEARWWNIKTWLRHAIPLAAPVYGLYMRFFGTRAGIARHMGMNLRRSRQDILVDANTEEMIEVLLDWLDQRLLEIIDQQRQHRNGADLDIGVLVGARHMRAVIGHLVRKCRYRIAKAEWTSVLAL